VQTSDINFDELSEEIIDAYVLTEEWVGKSGGFGIESHAGTLIKSIAGCYYNIVGLPLNATCRLLIQALAEDN
jgi:septum formation protein